MNRILLFLIGLCASVTLIAQSSTVNIKTEDVYLGRLPLQNVVKYNFEFTVNQGSQAQVKDIKTDCACAVVDYPTSVLRGGQTGRIQIEFDPYRPGPFEKHFTISWEGSNKVNLLVLRGYIEPEVIPVDINFPVKWGKLRLKSKTVAFGNIPNQDVVRRKVEVYNPTNTAITLKDSLIIPKYVAVVWENPTIPAMGKSSFYVFFNPALKNDFGFSLDNLVFHTSDPTDPTLPLNVSSNIYLDSKKRPVVAQPKLPEIWVSDDTLSLGKVFSNNSFLVSFVIYNKGKEKLIIHEIVPDVNCEVIEIDKKELAQYEYTNVKVRVKNLFQNYGTQTRTIRVINNDPKAREKELIITADVIK